MLSLDPKSVKDCSSSEHGRQLELKYAKEMKELKPQHEFVPWVILEAFLPEDSSYEYMYPAYECFKTVERNKPEIEQLRFWCQYWTLVVVMTIFERAGDTFVSWVPMYNEAKLASIIYSWCLRTKALYASRSTVTQGFASDSHGSSMLKSEQFFAILVILLSP